MGAVLSSVFLRQPSTPCTRTQYSDIPPPGCVHFTLTSQHIQDRDLVIVGDVHGCLDELKELVRIIEGKYGKHILYIFVGDLINKGPKSVETLHFIRELNSFAVRGNHEERMIKEWMAVKSGELSEFSEKYKWMSGLTDGDMEYIFQLPYTISIPEISALVVHAGLSPWRALNSQIPRHMITMRNIIDTDVCSPKETESITEGLPWASLWPGPQHVYFGHDARRRLQLYKYTTGLDTGCVYGGSLSAVCVTRPHQQLISVQAKHSYKTPGSFSSGLKEL